MKVRAWKLQPLEMRGPQLTIPFPLPSPYCLCLEHSNDENTLIWAQLMLYVEDEENHG